MAMACLSVILPSFYPLKIQNKQRSPMTGLPQAEVVMFQGGDVEKLPIHKKEEDFIIRKKGLENRNIST